MLISDIEWIRSHGKKLCPKLRHEVINLYRPKRGFPCFLQSLVLKWREKFNLVNVIIEHHPDLTTEEVPTLTSTINQHKCKVAHHLPIINGISGKLTLTAISDIASHPGVKKIWLDRDVQAVMDIAAPVSRAPESWEWGYTGEGITVAIIDTGIYPHPDLTKPSQRLIAFKDFINNKTEFYDDNGHGTHVAGCVAGNGSSSGERYKGTAPRANLVGIKVLDKMGSGQLSKVIAGIQWCIDQKENLGIKVINLSLGSSALYSYEDDPVCIAVEKAWSAGIVVVVAAGNEGPEAGTIGSPGIDPVVITVGATDDKNTVDIKDDGIADFSSRGPTIDRLVKPDVVAPGVNIISLAAPGSYLYKQLKNKRVGDNYLMMSGTSMATPICTGIIALILQAYPQMDPDQVKEIITDTARPLNHPRNDEGYGYVDAFACIKSLKALT